MVYAPKQQWQAKNVQKPENTEKSKQESEPAENLLSE